MKYLKKYNLFESSIYDADWNKLLPQEMIILKDGEHAFKLGNVMKHSDMIQVTYENTNNEWGVPSTLEFDFFFSEQIGTNNKSNTKQLVPKNVMRIDVDITWGDAMACEFYIDSTGKVGVIEYTSFHSKTDPSNTIFALDDNSLKSFVEFLNRFDNFNFDVTDFKFLDRYDDYLPN
jgi:hypothetical protein